MTEQQVALCEGLKRLGFAAGERVRMYGEEFDLVSDPIALQDQLVFVDAIERRSGGRRRVRIPLPIVRMVGQEMLSRTGTE